jgi:DNA-directed RNA polymerase I subunit RPA1
MNLTSINAHSSPLLSFYTDAEVKDRSVVEITSPQAFDPNHTALAGGLYDPRMGPAGKQESTPCSTCALKFKECPGHFGHIPLTIPVYHPLLFMELLQVLRCKCLNCHKFKAPLRPIQICKSKFYLLQQDRMAELVDLDINMAAEMRKAREAQPLNASLVVKNRAAAQALDHYLTSILPPADTVNVTTTGASASHQDQTSHFRMWRKQLVKETMEACKSVKRCHHCGAMPPKLRHDSHNKIFQAALSRTHQRVNDAEDIVFTSALEESAAVPAKDKKDDDSEEEKDYDSDDTSRGDDNAMDTTKAREETKDNEEEQDDVPSLDKYMHPGEVQAQLKRLWALEPFLCNCLFGALNSGINGYQVFFLQTIAVPPSRFRPPMFLNGTAVEHSQTQYLSRMLTLHETIQTHFAAGDEPRAYTAWIDLQTVVNCFMDSSKDPSAMKATPPGIKQILERKEGLFRKHMMGKRVDYACRSVISPDPYVGTNEIGLPHYFATVLTYPEYVTDYNIQQMRDLVERGQEEYPGALWVEMDGNRLDLSKMNRHRPALVGRQLKDGDYVLMNRQVRTVLVVSL